MSQRSILDDGRQMRGRWYETGKPVVITADQGRVTHVQWQDADPQVSGFSDHPDGANGTGGWWLAPAFLDLQVNGFAGHDFNRHWRDDQQDEAAETFRAIVDRASRAGTGMLCPTVCTASREQMVAALTAIRRARETDARLAAAMPTIHIEGPFLAPEDGPRGAHPAAHIRDPNHEEFQRLQDAAGGLIRLFTLAPERPGALPLIETLAAAGVVVAIGHTAATPEQIRDAASAGARVSTHLGNGAHAVLPRHPNYLWEQLADDRLTASIIADGHHLPPAVVKCVARVKSPDRLCLVSDAVALGGLPAGLYNDGLHEVLPNGKVVLAGTPYLAGAGHLLDTCVANALRFTGAPLADIIRAATITPARLLGLEDRLARPEVGAPASFLRFRLPEGEAPLVLH
jgi:N-acetylglucosamine-6-phosphate deacetylase